MGHRRRLLETTLHRLSAMREITLLRASHWVRTPPMAGGTARNWFLNGVALLHTSLEPLQLLERCIALEEAAGRRRGLFWADRPLDLDLLLVEDVAVESPVLTLPHPGIVHRRFVLEPLLQVWPDAVHPQTGVPYASLPSASGPKPVKIGLLALHAPSRYLAPSETT
ncbi:MAG: 2-amino-4-hydroxy-6-hydroxymethyldihydropteridine diphosphokinase [Myxococcales bacterium]|nr:2-amino-4-hydroxy-6-hydroxymethyldihydropteridine diphosphokinase [Myxococcales bacterium]